MEERTERLRTTGENVCETDDDIEEAVETDRGKEPAENHMILEEAGPAHLKDFVQDREHKMPLPRCPVFDEERLGEEGKSVPVPEHAGGRDVHHVRDDGAPKHAREERCPVGVS